MEQAIAERRLKGGQLVIVDEASLAGTFALDELVGAARQAGSKIVLVGDGAQLGSVEAGEAFSLLVKDRRDLVPELTDVRRFRSEWEKAASIELRQGNQAVIDDYEGHGRITEGTREVLLDAIYAAWKNDVDAGKSSLMIAGDSTTVTELNARARADRVKDGTVSDEGLPMADGQTAGVGDEVVTRQNNRLITTGRTWVKNGDRWIVTATNPDGTLALRRANGAGEVLLPADYVVHHVELAYATTAYRAQGRTTELTDKVLPPVLVRANAMTVVDGWHLVLAARIRGEQEVRVRMLQASEKEAFLIALRANATHGKPLSLAERLRAASRLLERQPEISNRAVADVCALSSRTVARQRKARTLASPVSGIGPEGRKRRLSTRVAREEAAERMSVFPDDSNRKIAREVGVSEKTVRDVRHRIKRGESPLP
jgi:hypothetical protein